MSQEGFSIPPDEKELEDKNSVEQNKIKLPENLDENRLNFLHELLKAYEGKLEKTKKGGLLDKLGIDLGKDFRVMKADYKVIILKHILENGSIDLNDHEAILGDTSVRYNPDESEAWYQAGGIVKSHIEKIFR